MATNDFDRESFLTFISEMDKRVEDLKKEISALANESGAGMDRASVSVKKFGESGE